MQLHLRFKLHFHRIILKRIIFSCAVLIGREKGVRGKIFPLLLMTLSVGLAFSLKLSSRWGTYILLITHIRGVLILFMYFVAVRLERKRFSPFYQAMLIFFCFLFFLNQRLTFKCSEGGKFIVFTSFFGAEGWRLLTVCIVILTLVIFISSHIFREYKILRFFN